MRTDWSNVYAVIRREFLERVRKKSFLITTLITPIIFGAVMILPGVLTVMKTGKPLHILVVDKTGWAGPAVVAAAPAPQQLGNTLHSKAEESAQGAATLQMAPKGEDLEKIKIAIGESKVDGALLLESDKDHDLKATYFGQNLSSPQLFQMLNSRLDSVAVVHRLNSLGLDRSIADKLKSRVDLDTVKVTKGGKTREGSILDFLIPIALALVIYMMILMYGVAIMNGVLEEKNSKVVEVLLSGVRPFELMMGKIVGIASVGLLQYTIWFVLGGFVFLMNPMNFQAHMEGSPVSILQLVLLVLYFILGFIFYSSLYAAIGSFCTTQQEAQQLQMPVASGLIIPAVLMAPTLMTPNANWVVALSLIPVSSPITMLLRTGAVEVPYWQIGASLALLVMGTIGVAWLAGRIFRVGILMTGKRPSIPEVLRWIRQA